MELDAPWRTVEERLLGIAERRDIDVRNDAPELILYGLRLAHEKDGVLELTDRGYAYYEARFVHQSQTDIREALADILRDDPIVTAFCGALWGRGNVQVTGAVSLLRRLTRSPDDASAKRWLELMNRADLIDYNRNKPVFRVKFNPDELVPPDETAHRERRRGRAISPDQPFGNLLALRELLESARGSIRWYEQHLPPKVLEVLYKEIDGSKVQEIRLLSGPANLTADAKKDFKRFADEMKSLRGITVEWRVLDKEAARQIHDRFFMSEGQSKNLPPLNTILAGNAGEILESEIGERQFDEWWEDGQPLKDWTPPT